MRIDFSATRFMTSTWFAGSIGLTEMPSIPLMTRSSSMRFWSERPPPGNSTVTSQPSCLPAAMAPAFAIVQKSATPFDTNATCGLALGLALKAAMRSFCAATSLAAPSCGAAAARPRPMDASATREMTFFMGCSSA